MAETGTELRIYGPPGTGKTTRLAREIGRAAERYGSDRVLAASFSKAAATELVGRNLPVDRAQVGTLHALCFRALGRPEIAETHLDEWNAEIPGYALSGGARAADVDDLGSRHDSERETEAGGDDLFGRYQILRARMTPRPAWPAKVQGFAERWEAWKGERGYSDFTDLIERGLHEIPIAPGTPAVGFFDEAQDFTALEFALCRAWAAGMEYAVFVGDDDQTIFRFKGASPEAFLSPLPDENKRVLTQSYRVPRAVHAHAARWIEHVAHREPKAYQPRDADGEVRRMPMATWKNPEGLLPDMERQLGGGKRVMVLASCSYMLAPLLAVLRQHGIPFQNPYRRARGDWNPLTPGRGVSAATRLLAYLRPCGGVWGEQAGFWTPQDLKLWVELLRADGVLKRGAKTAIDRLSGTDDLFVELYDWFESPAVDAAWGEALAGDTAWLESVMLPARRKALTFPMTVLAKQGGAVLREEPRVVIGTMHSVKGGEADVVYVLPDLSRSGMEEWMKPGEARDGVRRLLYVAFTRARESLVLCGAATRFAVDM